jgi:CIC family chloride channel protein
MTRRTFRLAAHRTAELSTLAQRSRQVVLASALVGVLTGGVVALFDRLVAEELIPRVFDAALWLGAVLPVVGLTASALILRHAGLGPATADEYLHAYHDRAHVLRLRAAAWRLVAAIATLGAGAPMGLEGPSLYTGATFGAALQRRLPRPFRHTDHRTLLVAGAAAGVAAIFKAPATGIVFALEVPYRDDLARRMLLPASVAAVSGYLVFAAINGTDPLFEHIGQAGFTFRDLAGAVVLGAFAGLGARLFARGIRFAKQSATRPVWQRLAVAGPLLVALFVLTRALTGESLTLGAGYRVVTWATEGGHAVWLLAAVLVIRCMATSAAIAAGGAGGIFIPLVAGGALVGRITGDAVHTLDPALFTVVGVAAFLGAGYRVPLASVMFVAETTGQPGFVVPGIIAAVAAELVMGTASVTPYQRSPRTGGGD